MIHLVFSVYDQKAAAYLPPFILPRSEMAIRTFSDCINSAEHQFGKHPGDYTLFRLGMFDDEKGQYHLEIAPISEGNGLEFLVDRMDAGVEPAKEGPNAKESSVTPSVGDGASVFEESTSTDSAE